MLPTESIDLHVVGDLALCEQTICSPAKQASCKQYTLGAYQIFEQEIFSRRLKDSLEAVVSCDSCRDQLNKCSRGWIILFQGEKLAFLVHLQSFASFSLAKVTSDYCNVVLESRGRLKKACL